MIEMRLGSGRAYSFQYGYSHLLRTTGRHTRTYTENSEIAYGYDLLGRLKCVTVNKRNSQPIIPEVTPCPYDVGGAFVFR
jgi:YD repeat-containing protein